jgi:hypothetical protein
MLLDNAAKSKKSGEYYFNYIDFFVENEIDGARVRIILDRIIDERVAEIVDNKYMLSTNKTFSIIKNGGYLYHIKCMELEKERERRRLSRESIYYYWAGKLSKWTYCTRFISPILAVIAIIVSITTCSRTNYSSQSNTGSNVSNNLPAISMPTNGLIDTATTSTTGHTTKATSLNKNLDTNLQTDLKHNTHD